MVVPAKERETSMVRSLLLLLLSALSNFSYHKKLIRR